MSSINFSVIEGFSAVQMKYDLQEQFQRKTAGMDFRELRRFLDETLDSPQKPTEPQSLDCESNSAI